MPEGVMFRNLSIPEEIIDFFIERRGLQIITHELTGYFDQRLNNNIIARTLCGYVNDNFLCEDIFTFKAIKSFRSGEGRSLRDAQSKPELSITNEVTSRRGFLDL